MYIKKLLALFLALALTVGLAGCGGETDNDVDERSEAEEAISEISTAEQPSETVTEVEIVTEVDDVETVIIAGEEYRIDIKELNLAGGKRYLPTGGLTDSDLAELYRFTNLTTLKLECNEISSIDFVAYMPNLTFLDVMDNNISDISVLSNLTKLETLMFNGEYVNDISALENLKLLNTLYIIDLSNGDLSVLSNLPIEKLYLENIPIYDLSILPNSLKRISFPDCHIEDISSMSHLVNLESIGMRSNKIKNIEVLLNFRNLKELYLGGCNLYNSDVNHISNLTNLEMLSLSNNNISNISALSNLKHLQRLNLELNPVKEEDIQKLQNEMPWCEIKYLTSFGID